MKTKKNRSNDGDVAVQDQETSQKRQSTRIKPREDAEPAGFLSRQKAGKPELDMVTCQFEARDAAYLKEFAAENGLSRSELVKQCILFGLRELGAELPSGLSLPE